MRLPMRYGRLRWDTELLGQTCAGRRREVKRKIEGVDTTVLFRHLLSPQERAAAGIMMLGK